MPPSADDFRTGDRVPEISGPSDQPPTSDDLRPADCAAPFARGTVLAGRYEIESHVASGTMGPVYRAFDRELEVTVALETVGAHVASQPERMRRLKREVLLARSVSHPNVCRIFDIGFDPSSHTHFLTMEFFGGDTLADRIARGGALTSSVALPLVAQMASALDAAHDAGILHRGFGSRSVRLVPRASGDGGDRVVVTDFGLATALAELPTAADGTGTDRAGTGGGESDVAGTGVVGTPAYMSPEQVENRAALGPASDRYSLGVVLFEMCTGVLPFRRASALETARARLEAPPPSPKEIAEVDDHWESTILRLLSTDPTRRFGTSAEVVLSLEGRLAEFGDVAHSIPPERDPFVGREAELREVATHLEGAPHADPTRLLSLLGTGGLGKTRLARKYGWSRLHHWPGGVFFCDLSEARDEVAACRAVARSLGVTLGRDEPVRRLGGLLASESGRRLVILDNFEQVVDQASHVLQTWLDSTQSVAFLVTTRERLQLPEERVLAVLPLDPANQGIELLETRARLAAPSFRIDDSNRALAEEIVRQLDGLPLAIEMAAARLRVLTLEQLRERLGERFAIMSGGPTERQSTLRSTLDWSWDLLEPWERSALAQLSVFQGGFTLEAAEEVVGPLGEEDAAAPDVDVLGAIESLVDKSWLLTEARFGQPRFSMLMTVHEYAGEKLEGRREAEARHGDYFRRVSEDQELVKGGTGRLVRTMGELHLEIDNLVAASRRAAARGDGAIAAANFRAASVVFIQLGPYSASVRLGEEVLDACTAPRDRMICLNALADSERVSGRLDQAAAHYEGAIALSRELGLVLYEGTQLGSLAVVYRHSGRIAEAHDCFRRALEIQQAAGERRSEAIIHTNLANLLAIQGRLEEAAQSFEAGLEIVRELRDRRLEGLILCNLGNLMGDLSRPEESLAYNEQALAIMRELDDRTGEGNALTNLVTLYREKGLLDKAEQVAEAALARHRELGNRRTECLTLGSLGALHEDRRDFGAARAAYEGALVIAREVSERHLEGTTLGSLGALSARLGRFEDARAFLESALEIQREIEDRPGECTTLAVLGSNASASGDRSAARRYFEECERVHRELERYRGVGQVCCLRASYELENGNVSAARGALAEAESVLAKSHDAETGLTLQVADLRDRIAALEGDA
ncbi:MAG: tetratricopeptide repeat protein [Candidatus Eisenbacteria bacterium]